MKGMIGIKAKVALLVAALGLGAGGAGLAGHGAWQEKSIQAQVEKSGSPDQVQEPVQGTAKRTERVDPYGDPLPAGVISRIGTMRMRHPAARAVVFSPDGKALVTGGDAGFGVCLWDTTSGKRLHRFPFPGYARSFAFSGDGKTLISSDYSALWLVDVTLKLQPRVLVEPLEGNFFRVALSPDGQIVAVAEGPRGRSDEAKVITLRDTATGKELRQLKGHTEGVLALRFTVDGKTLISGSMDKSVRFWDVATGTAGRQFDAHEKSVLCIAFSGDGKLVAAAARDGTVQVRAIDSGKLLDNLIADKVGKAIALSADGKLLAFSGAGPAIRVWDMATGKQVHALETPWPAMSLTFSPDAKTLAAVGSTGSANRLWDLNAGRDVFSPPINLDAPSMLQFSEDGKTLRSGGGIKDLHDWDLKTGQESGHLFSGPNGSFAPGAFWSAFDLSSDGKTLAWVLRTIYDNKGFDIHLWDTAQQKELGVLTGHNDLVLRLKFSPDGKLLVSEDYKKSTRLWNVSAKAEVPQSKDHFDGIQCPVAFSPDNTMLASLAGDNIRLLDVATGKETRRWGSQQEGVRHSLAFSPDGKWLVSSTHREVRVWLVATGELLQRFAINEAFLSPVFSPTGRILAVEEFGSHRGGEGAEYRSDIHLWDWQNAQKIRTIELPQGAARSMAFSRDCRVLATGGVDATILLWDLTGQSIGEKSKAASITAAQLSTLWSDMAGAAPIADRAIWTFVLSPAETVPYLTEQMRPPVPLSAEKFSKLLGELGSDQFSTRQAAALALEKLGESAQAAIRQALKEKPALEVRQRLEQILKKSDTEMVRKVRAIEALELIGSAQTRMVLESVVTWSPDPRVVDTAQAALKRLANAVIK